MGKWETRSVFQARWETQQLSFPPRVFSTAFAAPRFSLVRSVPINHGESFANPSELEIGAVHATELVGSQRLCVLLLTVYSELSHLRLAACRIYLTVSVNNVIN